MIVDRLQELKVQALANRDYQDRLVTRGLMTRLPKDLLERGLVLKPGARLDKRSNSESPKNIKAVLFSLLDGDNFPYITDPIPQLYNGYADPAEYQAARRAITKLRPLLEQPGVHTINGLGYSGGVASLELTEYEFLLKYAIEEMLGGRVDYPQLATIFYGHKDEINLNILRSFNYRLNKKIKAAEDCNQAIAA